MGETIFVLVSATLASVLHIIILGYANHLLKLPRLFIIVYICSLQAFISLGWWLSGVVHGYS